MIISDFIDEVSSFLTDGEDMARESLGLQTEGYWTNEMLLDQVSRAIDIFEWKHPQSQGLFLFDNAPSQKKVAADALSAEKLNVHPGGKQPARHSMERHHPKDAATRGQANTHSTGEGCVYRWHRGRKIT